MRDAGLPRPAVQHRAARSRGGRSRRSPTPAATAPASAAAATPRGCSSESSYRDAFDDYLGFLEPRLREVRRLLAPEGTLYFHIDYREAHYCKLLLDELFGRECFLNELIWAYDYGAQAAPPLAGQARHDPRLRQGPRALPVRLRRGRPRALHGARASSRRSSASAASARATRGGTRSSPRPGARRPATRRRSPRGSCAAWCRPRRAPATCAWTRSRARARSARWRPSSAAATC